MRVIFNYVSAFFEHALLARLVESRTKESIALSNSVAIEIHTCSMTSTRGYTCVAVIADEIAFWPREDMANADVEVLNALRPSLATTGGLLLCISSPYSRRGVLWSAYKENWGKAGSNVLVWKASSREMNPSLSAAVVALAYARDSQAASAEFGGEFRSDLESFITQELVDAAMRHAGELPPLSELSYVAFTDPSGGASDAFTLAIAHVEGERVVLDVLREVTPPFQPERVVAEFSEVLRRYRCSEVTGDRYGGEFPRELFSKRGVVYRVSERNRSEIYTEFLPLLTGGVVDLPEHVRLRSQLVALERKTGRGKDIIDHPPGQGCRDDCANVCAGSLVLAAAAHGGVLGLVELFKEMSEGKHLEVLTELSLRSKPPQPAAQLAEVPAHKCSRCGGPSHQHPQAHDSFRCKDCGHVDTVSRIVQGNMSRREFDQKEGARSSVLGRGTFGRFGQGSSGFGFGRFLR